LGIVGRRPQLPRRHQLRELLLQMRLTRERLDGLVDQLDLAGVDIDPDHLMTGIGELHRERQPDLPQSNNSSLHNDPFDDGRRATACTRRYLIPDLSHPAGGGRNSCETLLILRSSPAVSITIPTVGLPELPTATREMCRPAPATVEHRERHFPRPRPRDRRTAPPPLPYATIDRPDRLLPRPHPRHRALHAGFQRLRRPGLRGTRRLVHWTGEKHEHGPTVLRRGG